MWFMNKIANPFVSLILRSPLHGMMSAALLLITCCGRKSGREYTLPVQYVQDGHTIIIIPGAPEKKTWWRNLRGGAQVRLVLTGKLLTGKADVLEGQSETERITHALVLYLQRFPAAAKLHNVRPAGDGSFDQNDLRLAASATVVVQVELDQ
jgi:deazaflavin-dependent oxidoreductase (nitroreductase family)